MKEKFNVAILGATGLVGEALISILAERQFPVNELFLLASACSAGTELNFKNKKITVLDAAQFDFTQADIGLFSAGGSVSAEYAPKAAKAGCVVIDNTSRFRYEVDVPLVVSEVNPEAIIHYKKRNIIANPNCSTMQMLVAIKPIHAAVGITRLNIATYQAVSGTGRKAVDELMQQVSDLLSGRETEANVYSQRIAFNVLPECDVYEANGYTREEMKMVWETRKISQDDTIQINPTAARVPVFFGHSMALHLETRQKISVPEARALLEKAPGLRVMDERQAGGFPSAAIQGAHQDSVFVGRLREDISCAQGLDMWVVADNIRKGAALNAVQIAEHLIKMLDRS